MVKFVTAANSPPLLSAIEKGHASIVKLLLKKGATVDVQGEDGWFALIVACQNGHREVVKILVENGAKVDLQKKDGWSALTIASQNGHVEVVKLLLESGAKVDLQGAIIDPQKEKGVSALMLASFFGHDEVVKILLKNRATVDLQDEDGTSALMIASQNGHAEVVKILHENGAKVDLQKETGVSALMLASMYSHCDVVKILIENGANVNLQENEGFTALIIASQNGHCEVIKILLKNGAEVDLQEKDGGSALMLASYYGRNEVVMILLENGAKVNLQNHNGWSALMNVSQTGHAEVVTILLKNEAEVNLQNSYGRSALMFASENGHGEVVKVLLQHGANIDLRDESGRSALSFACENGHTEVVELLLDNEPQASLEKGNIQEIKAQESLQEKDNKIYIDAYRHFVLSKDILEMPFLKFLFLGPPGQGKTTALRRLMGEIEDLESAGEAKQPHASTGTVECGHDMIVEGLSDTTAVITGRQWSAVHSLTDEAHMLFHNFVHSVQSRNVPVPTSAPSIPTASVEENTSNAAASTAGSHINDEKLMKTRKRQGPESLNEDLSAMPEHAMKDLPSMNPTDIPEISALLKELSENSELWKEVKHSLRAYLRMFDTGGQPELMDMLPALTIGPGLFLLFFSYEFQLDEEYQVFYQRASGEKTSQEISAFTLKEMLLSILSSISCSSSSNHLQQLQKTDNSDIHNILKSSKSVVHIVGTHKDKVSEEYTAKVDAQLQSILEGTDFYKKGIVQYYSNDKIVVSLDNMRGGAEEVNQLRQLLEKAMEKHFEKLKIPAVWLFFSFCLRKRNVRTASMETCLKLSRAFNMAPYETKVALWFLHHHAGMMMYFPNVSGLEDLVILDIQVVYDSITRVILQAMSFDNVGKAKADRFRKTGQFTLKDLKSATTSISEDVIPPQKLISLLAYLHIIAQILSEDSSHKELISSDRKYIMPCVLEYTTSKELDLFHKEACFSCHVFPLSIYFSCGFTPMGLFSALIACLISDKSFAVIGEGIKKNMAQFLFRSQLHVTFISRLNYYEIIISCPSEFHRSLHMTIAALKSAVENILQEASSRMNYSSYLDYQFGFECSLHEGQGHLAIVDNTEGMPKNMTCLHNPDNPQLVALQKKHLVWYGQKSEDHDIMLEHSRSKKPFSIFMRLYPDLVCSVKPCVLTVADHCISRGLISEDVYEQITKRGDWIDADRARCLLNNVRTVFSTTPQALEEFVSVLLEVEYCKSVAEKLQQQL